MVICYVSSKYSTQVERSFNLINRKFRYLTKNLKKFSKLERFYHDAGQFYWGNQNLVF